MKLSLLIREAHRALGGLFGADHWLEVQDGRMPFAIGERVTIRANLPELGLRNGMAAEVVGIRGSTLRLRREGKTYAVDTSAGPDHRAVEHGYVATTYREMGATRTVSLAMLTRYENSASLNIAFSRHTDAFEAFFSHEHCGSYENVVGMAEHDRVKLSAHEVAAIEQTKYQARLSAEVAQRERVHVAEAKREVQAEHARAQRVIDDERRSAKAAARQSRDTHAPFSPDDAARHARNFAIAQQSLEPIAGTPGEAYLRERGCVPTDDVAYCRNWGRDLETLSTNADGTSKRSPGHGPAVVFLGRNRDGVIIGAQGKYIVPPMIAGRPLPSWTVGPALDMVFATPGARTSPLAAVVEGGPDALAIFQNGVPAYGCFGTNNVPQWLPDELAWREVILGSDPDKAGDDMAKALEPRLTRSETYRVRVADGVDLNDAAVRRPTSLAIDLQRARQKLFDPLGRAWLAAHRAVGMEPNRTVRQAQINRDFDDPSRPLWERMPSWEKTLLERAEKEVGVEQRRSVGVRR
jgi:hypothetical protein